MKKELKTGDRVKVRNLFQSRQAGKNGRLFFEAEGKIVSVSETFCFVKVDDFGVKKFYLEETEKI